MQKLFSGFIFGNFWISIIAVMMCFFTQKALGLSIPDAFLPFVGFSALTSYSFHAYLSSFYLPQKRSLRIDWIAKHDTFLLIQSIISGIISLIFYLKLVAFSLYLIPIIFATFLYSAPQIPFSPFIYLRKIAIAKTLYLSLSWAYVSVILPFLIGNDAFFDLKIFAFSTNRFLLIYIIAILFDRKDKELDAFLQIKNIIRYLNSTQIKSLIALYCCLFGVSAFIFYKETENIRLFFALLLPMFFLLISLPFIEKTDNDYVYYAYLDGLLLLSSLCML